MMKSLIYIGVFFGLSACARSGQPLRTGDLLFQAGRESAMGGAIKAATGNDCELQFTQDRKSVV